VQAGVGVLAVLSRALGVFSVACCAPGVVPGMPQPAVRRGWLSCGPGAGCRARAVRRRWAAWGVSGPWGGPGRRRV